MNRALIDWASYRRRFPALSNLTYLNTAGGSAMSEETAAAAKQYFDESVAGGDTHWPRWLERAETVRQSVADHLNASAREIAFMPTASLGMNLIAQMLAKPGDRLIAAEREFPSTTLPWLNRGAELSFLPLEQDGSVRLRECEWAVDARTNGFIASHVQYQTGYRYDLEALGDLCEANDLRLIVDATQSVGAYPVDVKRDRIAALVFSGYKWTAAGYGVAVLYMREDLLASSPLAVVGWRSARVPYDMLYDRLDVVHEGHALEAGHPPFAGIFALGASLSLIREIGVERIAERITELTGLLHQRLKAKGYRIASPERPEARSGITLVPVSDAKAIAKALKEQGVFVSTYGPNLRISLHFYNNEDDIQVLLDRLGALSD
ncbi:MAG: aminotransferase class V-fold PLP-dependent enzyme [Alphaproteobacteria bacterium]|nr:aminotransferase class V-fold PLP-dependent enzyme [Alphaproteobacteria bacterium]